MYIVSMCALFKQVQAEQRAAALRDELNKRRKNLQQRLDNERIDREHQVS